MSLENTIYLEKIADSFIREIETSFDYTSKIIKCSPQLLEAAERMNLELLGKIGYVLSKPTKQEPIPPVIINLEVEVLLRRKPEECGRISFEDYEEQGRANRKEKKSEEEEAKKIEPEAEKTQEKREDVEEDGIKEKKQRTEEQEQDLEEVNEKQNEGTRVEFEENGYQETKLSEKEAQEEPRTKEVIFAVRIEKQLLKKFLKTKIDTEGWTLIPKAHLDRDFNLAEQFNESWVEVEVKQKKLVKESFVDLRRLRI